MILNDVNLVKKTPLLTTILLESGNLLQISKMIHEHSSKGQNVFGWLVVNIALCFWFNYYRVMLPDDKFARIATSIGILINASVIATVLYFRY